MIHAIDEDVVDIQVQATIGFAQYRIEEGQLVHLAGWHGIGRHIFHADTSFQHVLHMANALGDIVHRLAGKGDWHQVIELPLVTAVRQVFGVGSHLVAVEKAFQVLEEGVVQRRRPANRKRQPVAHQWIAFTECL